MGYFFVLNFFIICSSLKVFLIITIALLIRGLSSDLRLSKAEVRIPPKVAETRLSKSRQVNVRHFISTCPPKVFSGTESVFFASSISLSEAVNHLKFVFACDATLTYGT